VNQSDGPKIPAAAKTRIISYPIIAAILFAGLTMACSRSDADIFPDVDAMLCVPKPQPPLLKSAEAVCFATYVDGVADSLRAAQQQANYDGWMAKARRGQDFNGWEVRIQSRKRFPVFICKISFTEDGNLMYQGLPCGFNK
jgi:hypothetical protein